MAVTDIVSRPIRAGTQGGLAFVLVEFVDSFFYDMTDRQYGALVALLSVVVSWVQVAVENKTQRGFLRKPEPPPKPVEVVEEGIT